MSARELLQSSSRAPLPHRFRTIVDSGPSDLAQEQQRPLAEVQR